MAISLAAPPSPAVLQSSASVGANWLRWTNRAVLFASTSIVVGLIWDISWHRSVGRDTFWTLPHVLEQIAAIVAGLSCGGLVLRTTFAGTPEEKARSVRFWGFRGPLGAWVCIWGTLMIILSAPFDDWWHNAYGLDVKIVSPPHIVLLLGMVAIQVGAMLMMLAQQNQAQAVDRRALGWRYVVTGGILVTMMATAAFEYTAFPNYQHNPLFYQVTAGVFPLLLVAIARAGRLRWPATAAAGVYMGLILVMAWILQLFPATPRLAPIYNPITHMVPPPFPLLLVIPAVGIDWVLQRVSPGRGWLLSLVIGIAFVELMLVSHWFFSEFLLTPAARNHFFAIDQWDYNQRLGPWRYRYWNLSDTTGALLKGFGIAVLIATASSRVGLWWGNWMARVRR